MTTTWISIELPGVDRVQIEYSGSSQELEVILEKDMGGSHAEGDLRMLVSAIIASARVACPHEPSNLNIRFNGFVVCEHCDGQIRQTLDGWKIV